MRLLLELVAVIFCITLPISPVLLEELPEVLGANKIIPAYSDRRKLLLPNPDTHRLFGNAYLFNNILPFAVTEDGQTVYEYVASHTQLLLGEGSTS